MRALSCSTLCDCMDCSILGSPVPGIFQVRTLDWVATSYSRGSSQPRDQTHISGVSCTDKQIRYHQCHLRSLCGDLSFSLVISLFLFHLCFPLLEPMFSSNDFFFFLWNVTCLYSWGQRIIINMCSVPVHEQIDTCGMTDFQQTLRKMLSLGLTKMQIWYLHSGLWDWGNSDHACTLCNYLQLIYPSNWNLKPVVRDWYLTNLW